MNARQRNVYEERKWSEQVGVGTAFGTFGELLQGCIQEGKTHLDFLVTLPISCYSCATFVSDTERTCLEVEPLWKHKSRMLVEMLLEYYHLPLGGRLTIESDLPIGKGLASSSADLVATVRAVCSCFGMKISPELVQDFLREIEPSDGVMYSAVVAFYHKQVRLREFLGALPPLTIVGIDEGGEVDTCRFNETPKLFTMEEEQEYLHLLHAISTAVKKQDVSTIGRITTRSAVLNQKLHPKQTLEEIIAICEEVRGVGVVVAHSGTCLGILLSPLHPEYRFQLQKAQNFLAELPGSPLLYYSLERKK